MKKVLIVVFAFVTLCAGNYNKTLSDLHSKIFHKIILLDKDLEKKLVKDEVFIHILHEESDYFEAENFKELINGYIQKKYPYSTTIKLTKYKEIDTIKTSSALFLLDTKESNIKKAVDLATKLKIISYSYNPDYLDFGVIISLDVGRTIKPYINFDSVKTHEIRFNPIILRISKGYNK